MKRQYSITVDGHEFLDFSTDNADRPEELLHYAAQCERGKQVDLFILRYTNSIRRWEHIATQMIIPASEGVAA